MLVPLLAALLLSAPLPARPDTSAIVPRRLSVDLVIDPARDGWTGSTRGWLTVRRPVRSFVLRFGGPVISRIEMNQLAGNVPLQWGPPRNDSLVVVTDRGLVRGPAGINVACVGGYAASGPGFARVTGGIALTHPGGRVVPAWPAGAPQPTLSLDVHVPAGCVVHANLPFVERTRQGAWRTWSYASKRAFDPDRLRLEVRSAQR
jgi:hypothetical protein